MPCVIAKLTKDGFTTPPPWLPDNTCFEAITGSESYGCHDPDTSDVDVVGFCIPPKQIVFPHLDGRIAGFGPKPPSFDQYQQHHVGPAAKGKVYDVTIYSIVKFFHLCSEGNPNMIDALFVPRRCVLHSTSIYEHVRERRREFLHMGFWPKFRGYAYAQLKKLQSGRQPTGKRLEIVRKHGYDTKFAYHIVRLCLECEQILATGDLVLDRDRELYKAIRRGEWDMERIVKWFEDMEPRLEATKSKSSLPQTPDWDALNQLLKECMELHYGSLSKALGNPKSQERMVFEIENVIARYK